MASPVITVDGLGKQFHLGLMPQAYGTLRETVMGLVSRSSAARQGGRPTVWALRDVSFSVEQGEVVGVIGPNGAGKSTLLKILTRVMTPTVGSARMRGRVGSLLEVGTGFHPELTGRENVYLSGAILGMSTAEVRAKLDQIVDFAGVKDFLDTPVKRYSSGMAVRLGFAVAAHLEPEILLVDEVLAVGDAEFQRKCLGRMAEVSQSGRTILFVSHNMASISQLCNRCILLEKGQVSYDGDPASAISRYSRIGIVEAGDLAIEEVAGLPAQISRIRVQNPSGEADTVFDWDQGFSISVEVTARQRIDATIGLRLSNEQGILVCKAYAADSIERLTTIEAGKTAILTASFSGGVLNRGLYNCTAMLLQSNQDLIHRAKCPAFSIEPLSGEYNYLGRRKPDPSVIRPQCRWSETQTETQPTGEVLGDLVR